MIRIFGEEQTDSPRCYQTSIYVCLIFSDLTDLLKSDQNGSKIPTDKVSPWMRHMKDHILESLRWREEETYKHMSCGRQMTRNLLTISPKGLEQKLTKFRFRILIPGQTGSLPEAVETHVFLACLLKSDKYHVSTRPCIKVIFFSYIGQAYDPCLRHGDSLRSPRCLWLGSSACWGLCPQTPACQHCHASILPSISVHL